MRLTTRGRYAVMALVDLAAHGGGRPVTLAEIAARQALPLNYLEQLFLKLRRAGLVRSVRGPGGGYLLGRAAGELPIADIVLAVDEPIAPCEDPEAGADCLVQNLWAALGAHIEGFLGAVTVADVLAGRLAPRRRELVS